MVDSENQPMPEDHPAYYDFGSEETRIQQSQAMAMWAMAMELRRIADEVESHDSTEEER